MSFNLKRAKKRRRPIDALRAIVPDIRYSDLDTDDDGEIASLVETMFGRDDDAAIEKQAVHGRGDNWTEVGPGFNPYNTSPLVNPSPTGFGGRRWRENFPSSGDQHINDSGDKQKNTKGRATDEAFDENMRRKKINDKIDKARKEEKGNGYLVRIELGPDDFGSDDLAVKVFGDEGMFDGEGVYVEVEDFETAIKVEREQKARGRSVRIESKGDEQEK